MFTDGLLEPIENIYGSNQQPFYTMGDNMATNRIPGSDLNTKKIHQPPLTYIYTDPYYLPGTNKILYIMFQYHGKSLCKEQYALLTCGDLLYFSQAVNTDLTKSLCGDNNCPNIGGAYPKMYHTRCCIISE